MAQPDRKKLAVAAFERRARSIDLGGETTGRKGRVSVALADGTRVELAMQCIRGGLRRPEFAAYTTLGIYGGPVYEVLEGTRLAGGSSYPKDLIVQGTTHALVPTLRRGVYVFRESGDVEAVVGRMVGDVRRHCVPIVAAFTSDYGRAVDFILSTKGAHVRKPFCMAIALLGLAGTLDRAGLVVAQAKKSPSFWDFHRAKDPEAIVDRVRAWTAKHARPAR